jgi:tetratricopeptide (TPR) repeat protein
MKNTSFSMAALVLAPVLTLATAATVIISPLSAVAQATAVSASIHGVVTNAAGQPVKDGVVKLTTDRSTNEDAKRKYEYTFPVGADGTYKGSDIKPGDYVLFYQVNDKTVDFVEHVVLKAGDNITTNDDMSREEFLKAMTPEQRKQIEDFKKKNAEAANANKTVANLNTLLTKARDEEKANNYDAAVADMTQATTQKGDEAILWLELGNAQLGQGTADKDATNKNSEFEAAATSYQKAADVNAASKKPNPAYAGAAYNGLGQAYGKESKPKEASDAYDKAAQAEPAKAGMYYFNEAVTAQNAGSSDAAAAAADKAIAADPTKADAYYIKGQALVGKSTVDSKSGKIIPPPGCLEAYSKYLDLAPTGKFAPDVKSILANFDEKVVSNYKATRKK